MKRFSPKTDRLLAAAMTGSPAWRGWRYRWIEPGYVRLCVAGWRIVLVDTRRRRPSQLDRIHGIQIGRILFRLSPAVAPARARGAVGFAMWVLRGTPHTMPARFVMRDHQQGLEGVDGFDRPLVDRLCGWTAEVVQALTETLQIARVAAQPAVKLCEFLAGWSSLPVHRQSVRIGGDPGTPDEGNWFDRQQTNEPAFERDTMNFTGSDAGLPGAASRRAQ